MAQTDTENETNNFFLGIDILSLYISIQKVDTIPFYLYWNAERRN